MLTHTSKEAIERHNSKCLDQDGFIHLVSLGKLVPLRQLVMDVHLLTVIGMVQYAQEELELSHHWDLHLIDSSIKLVLARIILVFA